MVNCRLFNHNAKTGIMKKTIERNIHKLIGVRELSLPGLMAETIDSDPADLSFKPGRG